jgi:predicted ATP-binding protein involved in virulence
LFALPTAQQGVWEKPLSEKNEDDPYASLFSDNVELLNAEEWLLQSDYAASKPSPVQRRAAKRRDDIKDVLINLLPDVEDIRFAQLTEKQMKPGVEVKTPYGWVSIKDLSLGYKTLIAWMVDLASRLFDRYPDSPNPLAEPAVVLVDEIDLHLHPKWQRNLMSFLSERFPNTQFIATAHSPLVVQAATDANIVLLRREGDHVIIDNDVKKIHGWRFDQVLTSDLFGLEARVRRSWITCWRSGRRFSRRPDSPRKTKKSCKRSKRKSANCRRAKRRKTSKRWM